MRPSLQSHNGSVTVTSVSARSSPGSAVPSQAPASAADLSLIHQAMSAKSRLIAGSDHVLDDVDPDSGARNQSSVRDRYPNSVSLVFGELTEDSSHKVMDVLALTSASRLLDVDSAFGRFCVHAVLSAPRGASVTGIEAGFKRAQLASQFVDELTVEHSANMAPVRSNIKLVRGDVLDHLAELFAHSHVFLFDARFMESTWHILAHLLSYLSGVAGQTVLSCQPLHKCNADLVRSGSTVTLTLSGGKQSFPARVYRVSPRLQRRHAVEVYQSAVHGLSVRAVRALQAGQTVMRVEGELVYSSTLVRQADVSKRRMWPYLTRMQPLDKLSDRAYMHAWDVSRYINSHVGTLYKQNVANRVVDGELYVVAVRDIPRGHELLSD